MQKFMKTIISAVKSWVKNDAFTADDALEVAVETGFVTPLAASDGAIYTMPNGDILTID